MAYNDGQHRQPSGTGSNDGQRSTHAPGAVVGHGPGSRVGQQTNNNNMAIGKPDRGSDIETTRGPGAGAGFPPHAATHPDADDKGGTAGGGA